MERKVYQGQMEFKADGEPGEFRAEFATLGVIDHQQDVTVKGAFAKEPVLIEPWNHDRTLPVGKGAIREEGDKAIIEGRFFLDTTAGSEHYKTVKELGELQEWSYSFDVLEHEFGKADGQDVRFLKKLHVIGVGPVTRGAGIDTRTVDIKEADTSPPAPLPTPVGGGEGSKTEGETTDHGKPSGEQGARMLPGVLRALVQANQIEFLEVGDGNQGRA